MHYRMRRLRRPERRRPLTLIFLMVIVSGLILFYISYRIVEKNFILKEVVVYGNHYLSEDDIMKIAGLKKGINIFRRSLSFIHSRLMASPWIKDATVRIEPPDRITIWIQESRPVAVVEYGGRYLMVDNEGRLLDEINSGSDVLLPVVLIDPSKKDLYLEALNLAMVLGERGITSERGVMFINGTRKEDLSLSIGGITIRFGYGRYNEKISRLLELAPSIKEKGERPVLVDLRFENRVIVKYDEMS